jgi:hypothetical protein
MASFVVWISASLRIIASLGTIASFIVLLMPTCVLMGANLTMCVQLSKHVVCAIWLFLCIFNLGAEARAGKISSITFEPKLHNVIIR